MAVLRLWLLLCLVSLPVLAQPYVPPGRSEISGKLGTTESSGQAAGTFKLTRSSLHMDVTGLLPGGIYSVKLVKVRPYEVEGVGPAPHSFTADAQGTASFDAAFVHDPTRDWNLLLIDYHPGGDATDRRSAKPVLRAVLSRPRS